MLRTVLARPWQGDTREEKVFRTWINSLGIDNGDLYINNLFADVQNGYAILKASERIWIGLCWVRLGPTGLPGGSRVV